MRQLVSLGVIVAMIGCGKKKSEEEQQMEKLEQYASKMAKEDIDRKPTGTPRPQPKLTVTLDGKPVAMATALAWKRPGGNVRITASSVAVTCGEVTGDMRSLYHDEVTFDVEMGQTLQPDGSTKPEQRLTYFSGNTNSSAQPAVATGDGRVGQPTTIAVDFATESAEFKGTPKKLVVKGTIDALGCEAPPAKDAIPLPPVQPATIEIAGKKLPVRGATLEFGTDLIALELRTGGETCKRASGEQSSELTVRFSWFKKDDPKINQVTLGGTMVKNVGEQRLDETKVIVKPAPPTAAGDFEISADIKVFEYPVKVEGKVTAVVCPKT